MEFLGSTCQVHFGWYTHRNIAGCWICDSITFGSVVLEELERVGPYVQEGRAYIEEEEEEEEAEDINGEVLPKDT